MTKPIQQEGRYFEDFNVGDILRHPYGRTVTDADNIWFSSLTQNPAAIHSNHDYSSKTEYGKPLINSTFLLALVTGQSVHDLSRHVFANLGWDEIRLPHPVFAGDTIYSQSEILETRDSKSKPKVGIITVKTTGFNQNKDIVITFNRTLMVYRHGEDPQPTPPTLS